MSKKVVIIVGLILFIGSLLPTANRTIHGVGDAHGLVVLAGLGQEGFTYNPYSKNGGFVSPAFALWILKNMDYPYKECPEDDAICKVPLIIWAGRGFETFNNGKKTLGNLIKHFVQRGYSVNESYKGLTALHESVLLRNVEYCELLLSLGANKTLRVNRPDAEYHNATVLQYYEYLKNKDATLPGELGNLLKEK